MINRERIERGRSRHSQDKTPVVAQTDGGQQRNAWLRIAGAQSDIQTEPTAVSKPKVLLLLLTARSKPPFLSKILRTFLTSKKNTIDWIKAGFTDTDGTCFGKFSYFFSPRWWSWMFQYPYEISRCTFFFTRALTGRIYQDNAVTVFHNLE